MSNQISLKMFLLYNPRSKIINFNSSKVTMIFLTPSIITTEQPQQQYNHMNNNNNNNKNNNNHNNNNNNNNCNNNHSNNHSNNNNNNNNSTNNILLQLRKRMYNVFTTKAMPQQKFLSRHSL